MRGIIEGQMTSIKSVWMKKYQISIFQYDLLYSSASLTTVSELQQLSTSILLCVTIILFCWPICYWSFRRIFLLLFHSEFITLIHPRIIRLLKKFKNKERSRRQYFVTLKGNIIFVKFDAYHFRSQRNMILVFYAQKVCISPIKSMFTTFTVFEYHWMLVRRMFEIGTMLLLFVQYKMHDDYGKKYIFFLFN